VRCHLITPSILRRTCPELGSNPAVLDAWAVALNSAAQRFPIAGRRQWAHFLGQIGVESAGFTRLEENMNYSAKRLPQVWRVFRHNPTLAAQYANKPRELANFIYGVGQRGDALGNTQPNDGWHFRGRGLKQLTGRANYGAYGAAINLRDAILTQPDLLTRYEHAAKAAAWFWASNNLGSIVDANSKSERDAAARVTRVVTGSGIALEQRTHRTMIALEALS